MELDGARALVTGGSSGIGFEVARLLASRGCVLTVVGSNPDLVHRAAQQVHGSPVVCDFADTAAVVGLCESLAQQTPFDLVVHSAGIGLRAPASEMTEPELRRVLAVNARAPILLTGALIGPMRRRGHGRVVFVGSIAGAVGAAGESSYAASKAAVQAFAASLRVELAGTGVGVTVAIPGVVATPFFSRRGVPYHRTRPKPVPPGRVAHAIVRAIERGHDLVTVPAWLRIPVAFQGAAPQWYGRMARRWGR